MKISTVFILAFFLLTDTLLGKIRNGYERQLDDSKKSLQRLLLLKSTNLSPSQRRKVKAAIRNAVNHTIYYEITEELLNQFIRISPDFYYQMDNLKDRQGRKVDVYVKLIPREQTIVPLQGATFFRLAAGDEDANLSEYGEHTVSVKIWIVSEALKLLYHELGHIRYIVPNFATYAKFYKNHYQSPHIPVHIGHNAYDLSGKLAQVYEARFRLDYHRYLKNGGQLFPTASALLSKISKQNRDLMALAQPDIAYHQDYPPGLQVMDLSRFP